MKIKVQKLHRDAILPRYATPGAACFDLHALGGYGRAEDMMPGSKAAFRTGLAFEVPQGHVMLIFSRSGHGFKNDIRLANCVGVIDSDYRGEVLVKLTSDDIPDHMPTFGGGKANVTFLRVNPGDRIAQAMILPIPQVELVEADSLSETERGTGGFGSTGMV